MVEDEVAIRLQLERLVESAQIRNSKRCQALLRYVVEASLDGALDKVRERNIGIEVFQREVGYDTNQDSVVRTTAAEVRKRLAQYYMEPGRETEIRVVLPPGSYAPEFRLPIRSEAPRDRRSWWAMAAIACGSLALGAWFFWGGTSDLDRFWMPLLTDQGSAVICIEQPLRLYRFQGERVEDLNQKMVGEPKGEGTVSLAELRPSGEQYFTYGDLMGAARLVELLSKRGKAFQVMGDRITAYHDLRGRPAVLLGQFNNKWTIGLTKNLRYYLDKNLPANTYEVKDREKGNAVIATVGKSPQRPEEFAIISRIFDPSTEKTVIAVAGTTFYGTLAGADFLTHDEYIHEAFRDAPPQWWKKNVQVVIRAPMVNGSPGPPQLLVRHLW